MKKIITVLILSCFFISNNNLNAQWSSVSSSALYDIYDIQFLNAYDIFLAGDDGLIKSSNGGNNWSILPLIDNNGTPMYASGLRTVHFFDTYNGVATGLMYMSNNECMLKTTNGGANWSITYLTSNIGIFHKIHFPNNNTLTAYSVGEHGRILKTTNGGNSWVSQNSGITADLKDVFFTSNSSGFATGGNYLLTTNNGGSTWQSVNLGYQVNNVKFINTTTGYIGAANKILKTTNSGSTWDTINKPPFNANYKIYPKDADTLIAIAGNMVFITKNGGMLWEKQNSIFTTQLNDFETYNWQKSILAGEDGKIYKTENAGGTPYPIASFSVPNNTICKDSTVNFINNSSSNYSYQWKINGVPFSTTYNANYIFANPNQYDTISLVANNGYNTDVLSTAYYVQPSLDFNLSFQLSSDTICYNTKDTILVPNSDNNVTYKIMDANAVVISTFYGNGSLIKIPIANLTNTVNYTIEATKNNVCGTNIKILPIHIEVSKPNINLPFYAQDTIVCSGDSAFIKLENSESGTIYQLFSSYLLIGPPQTGNGGTLIFRLLPASTKTYQLKATNTRGCLITFAKAITITPRSIYVYFSIQNVSVMIGDTLQITNNSNTDTYKWVIDTNFSNPLSTNANPVLTFNTPGIQKLTLTGNTIQGCTNTISKFFEVLQPTVNGNMTRCNSTTTNIPYYPGIKDYYIDNNKNHYYTGYKYLSSSNGNLAAFFEKRDSLFNVIWSREVQSYEYSFPSVIVADSKGNTYITGLYNGSTIYLGSNQISDYNYYLKSFLVKYDSLGIVKWIIYTKSNTGSNGNAETGLIFTDIDINKDDRIFIAGTNRGQNNFNIVFPDNSEICFACPGNNKDGFLLEIDTNGVKKDFVSFGGSIGIENKPFYYYNSSNIPETFSNLNPKIIADSIGNIHIAGTFYHRHQNSENFTAGNFQLTDNTAVFVAVYNKNAGWKSLKSIVKGNNLGPISQFKYDINENYFISGTYNNFFIYNNDTISGSFNYSGYSNDKFNYFMKSDSTSLNKYFYTYNNTINDFDVMDNGDVIAMFSINTGGSTQNILSLKNSQNQFFGRKTLGEMNYLFANIDSNGSLLWTNMFSGYNDDFGFLFRRDKCGDLYAITAEKRYLSSNYYSNFTFSKFATDGACFKQNCVAVNFTDAAMVNKNNWATFSNQNSINTGIPFINKGNTIINTIKVRVKNNLLSDTLFSWTGTLQPNDTVLIPFDSIPLYQGGNNLSIVIDSVLPGFDQNHLNDTIKTFIFQSNTPLNGIYTIGHDLISDFPDVETSAKALNNLGISGPVTFIIKPGTYYGQALFSNIVGVSPVNNITYKSQNNDSTSVLICNTFDFASKDYVLRFDTVSHFIFEHLTIKNNSLQQNISTILINQYSSDIQFKNNIISTRIGAANELINETLINGPSYTVAKNSIKILNNVFENGQCAIGFAKNASNIKSDSLIIKNNIFKNSNNISINASDFKNSLICDNIIESTSGMILSNFSYSLINSNYLHTNKTVLSLSGDFLISQLTNNIILSENGDGIYSYSLSNLNVYNNTILSRNAYCINYSNPSNVIHKNNIYVSTGIYPCIYSSYNNPYLYNVTSDYNTFYSNSGTNFYSNLIFFQNYQQIYQKDLHSKFYLPQFKGYNDLHILNDTTIRNKGVFLSAVLTDIDGDIRDTLPDIGADEFSLTTATPAVNVWPGDANADHTVNYLDIFPLGVYYGELGIPRQNTSVNWQAKEAYPWNQMQQNAINLCHADCNGNGIIDIADSIAVMNNINFTHTKSQLTKAVNAPISYQISKPLYFPGDTVKISISLGDSILQADSLYGLGISLRVINYNNIDTNTITMSFDPTWITNIQPIVSLNVIDKLNAQVQSAKVRTNKTNALPGYGNIALFSVKLKSANLDDSLKIEILSITGTDNNGLIRNYGSETISIALDTLGFPAAAVNISGPTAVCQEQNNVVYTVPLINNATSYSWTLPTGAGGSSTSNSISVNYASNAQSGNITVKGHNVNGDGTPASIAITVNPKPPTPIITQTGNTLTSNSSSGNQWYSTFGIITGANNITYFPIQNDSYYVIVTKNSCISNISNTITISNIGITEQSGIEINLNVQPNPFQTTTTITYTLNNTENTLIRVLDVTAREVKVLVNQLQFAGNHTLVFDAGNLQSGLYYLDIKIGNKNYLRKIILAKY